jgi:hypothetical protein
MLSCAKKMTVYRQGHLTDKINLCDKHLNQYEDVHKWRYCNNYKKHHSHLDKSPTDAQVSVSHLQKICWAAA